MVEILPNQEMATHAHHREDEQHRLLFSKSKVYVHPTAYARDNIPGFAALVKREVINPVYYLAWIPESLLHEKGGEEWGKFVRLDNSSTSTTHDEDLVFVDLPINRPESYAFSVPLSSIYSLIVNPPSLSSWHGSVTINLLSGSTPPTLYFHDDENNSFSPCLDSDEVMASTGMQTYWGGDDLLSRLRQFVNVMRSKLQSNLFLLDPSKSDIDTHGDAIFDDDAVDAILSDWQDGHSPVPAHRRPRSLADNAQESLLHQSLPSSSYPPLVRGPARTRLSVLQSLSSVTRATRHAAQTILSHPLAKPIVPHLPDPVKSLVNAEGEWRSWVEKSGTGDYEGARVYLARWARVVAEEGERSRIKESASILPGNSLGETTTLGVFEVLRSSANLPTPRTTRSPHDPITMKEWKTWFDSSGRGLIAESEMRGTVFKKGMTYNVRQLAWPYLLGILPWNATSEEVSTIWRQKRAQYLALKSEWEGQTEVLGRQEVQEEVHRIDVDCRRTDRTHALFAPESEDSISSSNDHIPIAQTPSNRHIQRLSHVLLTYNFYEKNLGYVQGMSDLCAPLYVVAGGDEVTTFWCFVAIMDRMGQNFLRDQTGMKEQLLTLQQLLQVMDPEMHRHLESADSLNLFFCFRWILVAFKREFAFDDVLRLWDVLWSDYLSDQFVLFVALAILESHRDVILRYLVEFDEVLKYCNDLSMTIELDSTLAQAEVLFTSFALLVDDFDRKNAGSSDPDAVPALSPLLRNLLRTGRH